MEISKKMKRKERELYLTQLKNKRNNGLVKIITGILTENITSNLLYPLRHAKKQFKKKDHH